MRERAVFRLRRPVHIEQAHRNRRSVHRLGSGPVPRMSTEPVETELLKRWAELEDEEMRRLHARYAWAARRASGRIVVGVIRILHIGEQLMHSLSALARAGDWSAHPDPSGILPIRINLPRLPYPVAAHDHPQTRPCPESFERAGAGPHFCTGSTVRRCPLIVDVRASGTRCREAGTANYLLSHSGEVDRK